MKIASPLHAVLVSLLAIIFLPAEQVQAATLQGTFTGTVLSINSGGSRGYPGLHLNFLDEITGTIWLDTDLMRSSTSDLDPGTDHGNWFGSGNWMQIQFTVATQSGAMSFGGGGLRYEDSGLELYNDDIFSSDQGDWSSDDYFLYRRADDAPPVGQSGDFESYEITLRASEIAALPAMAAMLNGDDPDQEINWVRGGNENAVYFDGSAQFMVARTTFECFTEPVLCFRTPYETSGGFRFESLHMAVVPLPAAVWLFGSALGVMGWMRRKAA